MADPIFISAEWIKPLWKKLLSIRSNRAAELASIGDVFGDARELAKYYVQSKCQQHNPADYHEDEAISVVRSPVFTTINDFLGRRFTTKADGKNQMFILSDSGMGKTSLLVMVRLMHLMSFWPQDHRCVLLKIGSDTLTTIASLEDHAKTVLLLDALDEDPEAWGRLDIRLGELLAGTDNFRRVIISCRTQFFPEQGSDPFNNPGRVAIGGRICPIIYLSLFDDTQIREYLQKRFPRTWYQKLLGLQNEKSKASEGIVLKMESLRFRPLLLAHVEDILASQNSLWNEYTTYDALLRAWLMREQNKSAERIRAIQLETACSIIAEEMQVSGFRHYSCRQLESLLAAHPELKQLSMVDVGGRSLLNRNAQGDYRFSHYTIQEFLVAKAVLNGSLRHAIDKIRATEQITKFVALGIVADVPPRDLNLLSSFVSQVTDPALLRKASTKLGWDGYSIIVSAINSATDKINAIIDMRGATQPGELMILEAMASAYKRGIPVHVQSYGSREEALLSQLGLPHNPREAPSDPWFSLAWQHVGSNGVRGLFRIDHHALVHREY